jgi:hypothetical protein
MRSPTSPAMQSVLCSQFATPSLLNGRILGRLDGKRLFHAAAENGIAVLVLSISVNS